jgi:hypothetical protein
MELINTKHHDILYANRIPPTITITEDHLQFTPTAVKAFGIEAGKYMHFVNPTHTKWYFLVNDDPDGFKIQVSKVSNKKGTIIYSIPLARMIRKSLRLSDATLRFYLQASEQEYNGTRLTEILTNKTINQLLKAA